MPPQKILFQGAEAKIILDKKNIIKNRIEKKYRHPQLDEKIRKSRTKAETKLLTKASLIIDSPKPLESQDFDKIIMPFIEGEKLSDNLNKFDLKKQKEIFKVIGRDVSKLHKNSIIHGDLTTSNMILKKNSVYLIDFGLGYISHRYEDKAVDLHLLKQALEAKHFQNWKILWETLEKEYSKSTDGKKTLEQLRKVESRGRYKERY